MSEEININQLLDKGDEVIQKLIDTGGRSWCLSVPARPNEDPDLVLSKIISEFRKERQARLDAEARLKALEDAIYESVMPPEPGDNGSIVAVSNFGEIGWSEIDQAIANSRLRQKEKTNAT